MLVHPDVIFATALADHRKALEIRRSAIRRDDQEETLTERIRPAGQRRRALRVAQS